MRESFEGEMRRMPGDIVLWARLPKDVSDCLIDLRKHLSGA